MPRPLLNLQNANPVQMVFVISLILSTISLQGHLINRDGIYYVETAWALLHHGFGATLDLGSWNFFLPLLIAVVSGLTSLHPEHSAYLLNALLLAGTCVLLVAWVRRKEPSAAWAACLVVLALPAYNQYRNEILREYGFWFFSFLGFWLAMLWNETSRRKYAAYCQCALFIATLFRLEATIFFFTLMAWQAYMAPRGQKIRRMLTIGALPAIGLLLAGLLMGAGVIPVPSRLAYYLDAINPINTLENIRRAGLQMTEMAFKFKYSREEAPYILFFGLISIIPIKFLKMCSFGAVPLIYQLTTQKRNWDRWQPLPWIMAAYLLTLVAFVTYQFFLVGRYVSMLNLLAVPLIASGLALMMRRFPRWQIPMLALALIMALANVVSLSPSKNHITDSSQWLAANVADSRRVGTNNGRIAYYAGWRNNAYQIVEWQTAGIALVEENIDLAALEIPKNMNIAAWLNENHLVRVAHFENTAGAAVIIVAKPAANHEGSR